MNRFVFITHVTPPGKRNSLREKLFMLYNKALAEQSYQNWKVIQFCADEEGVDGKFFRFRLPDVSREEKNSALREVFSRTDFQNIVAESDYLIKLDDDDLISPVILERLKSFTGDLYYDRYHTFVDVSSGVITQQKRPWVASTCVHRTLHALSKTDDTDSVIGNLLYTDHSKTWHKYYHNRQAVAADPLHPVYLRVLSPTSITSGGKGKLGAFSEADSVAYHDYLKKFGDWRSARTKDFNAYLPIISSAWMEFSGHAQKHLQPMKTSSLGNILRSLRNKFRHSE